MLKLREPLLNRTAQEIVAEFPARIAIDGAQFGIEGFIVVMPGEVGYYKPSYVHHLNTLDAIDALHLRCFGDAAPTEAQREAAAIGSITGWGVPGADPQNYIEGE